MHILFIRFLLILYALHCRYSNQKLFFATRDSWLQEFDSSENTKDQNQHPYNNFKLIQMDKDFVPEDTKIVADDSP